MKKLILSTAIILGGLTAVTAQTDKDVTAMNKQQQTEVEAQVESRLDAAGDVETVKVEDAAVESAVVQDYKEVKSADLPQVVQDAVATDFDGATIAKAYKNAQGDYKIELATSDAKKATVYANAKGEWIKNELKKQ